MLSSTDLPVSDVLVIAALVWLLAELAEVAFNKATGRPGTFLDSGGMPSSHSAVICAIATAIGLEDGFDSSLFALAAIVAVIVMHDATRVRWMAGVTAEEVNRFGGKGSRIAIHRGHRLSEVVAGAVLGIALAALLHSVLA